MKILAIMAAMSLEAILMKGLSKISHLFLAAIAVAITTSFCPSSDAKPINSYRQLRYDSVVGQTNFYTCGPAVIATLLTHYYGNPTTEAEILKISEIVMGVDGKKAKDKGISAFALRKALLSKGIQSDGIDVTAESLRDFFQKEQGLPIVLHVNKPQRHYVLAIGMVDDWLVIADPSVGQGVKQFSSWKLEKGFKGRVLVPLPESELWIAHAKMQQQKALSWATNRVNRLNLVKRRNS
jgi:uncharacterized protein